MIPSARRHLPIICKEVVGARGGKGSHSQVSPPTCFSLTWSRITRNSDQCEGWLGSIQKSGTIICRFFLLLKIVRISVLCYFPLHSLLFPGSSVVLLHLQSGTADPAVGLVPTKTGPMLGDLLCDFGSPVFTLESNIVSLTCEAVP